MIGILAKLLSIACFVPLLFAVGHADDDPINVVSNFGCIGDNEFDNAACLNEAISAAQARCRTVYLPSGRYRIRSSIMYRSCVSIRGSGRRSSLIVWRPETDAPGAALNLTNQNINGVTFSGFGLYKAKSGLGSVDGIVGGSNLREYSSGVAVFENLYIAGFRYGIAGVGDSIIGLFDSTFRDIWWDGNEYGFAPYGSQNTVINPRVTGNRHGYYLGALSGHSISGVQTFGGVFASNEFDITLADKEGIRPTLFKGTWFEGAKEKILNIPKVDTVSKGLTFEDCTLQSKSAIAVLDFSNLIGLAYVGRCSLVQTAATQSLRIKAPASPHATFSAKNLIKIDYRGNIQIEPINSQSKH